MKMLHLLFKKQKNMSKVLVGGLNYVIQKIMKEFNVNRTKPSFMTFF